MIDVNVYLGRWPFRRLPLDEPQRLVEKLQACGVDEAWCGSFDALLHEDLGGVNRRLVSDCQRFGEGLLIPIGSINPTLPDWEEDLRRCQEEYGMFAVRLCPAYHGYRLDSGIFLELLQQVTARGLAVQIAVQMEDERTQHPLLQTQPVDLAPLLRVLNEGEGLREARIMLLNCQRSADRQTLGQLAQQAGVVVDMAWQEGVGGVGSLIDALGPSRVVFGSYSPFFYFEAAEFKLRESQVEGSLRAIVTERNAAEFRIPPYGSNCQ